MRRVFRTHDDRRNKLAVNHVNIAHEWGSTQEKKMPEVGFEPTKLAYEILSLTPLTNLGTLATQHVSCL